MLVSKHATAYLNMLPINIFPLSMLPSSYALPSNMLLPYRPLFRHILPTWRQLGPAEERAGGKRVSVHADSKKYPQLHFSVEFRLFLTN